ncbi:MAG: class I SAM-dependent methyltransferase [Pseudanabaenaceae cyanobacterium bins.68]|nr:class I SAM-dependent methyltransferase [Pseudanabaenaceae cyanobacterium bins.68]
MSSSDRNPDIQQVTAAVAQLYDTYPFPPDPVLDQAPPGYNWRWSWPGAYGFCTDGKMPSIVAPRILDAGCGSGVSTEYLAHLNPQADLVAIDISAGTLAVAQERIARSQPNRNDRQISFHQLSLYDLDQIAGEFNLINCVGVLHHLADPVKGIQALAAKLAPGGLLHLFLYAEIGRWEIHLMQQAIALLSANQAQENPYQLGVKLGRQVFAALPAQNRLLQREKQRWALENHRDQCFADMYVHPQELSYRIDSLFELITASGLEFAGFSNPQVWQLEPLIGKDPELLKLAQGLPLQAQYQLIELLNTDIAHYEFFLYRSPLERLDLERDQVLIQSVPVLHPCIDGWESRTLFNPDYQVCNLSPSEFRFMQLATTGQTIEQILTESGLDLAVARSLLAQKLILLA